MKDDELIIAAAGLLESCAAFLISLESESKKKPSKKKKVEKKTKSEPKIQVKLEPIVETSSSSSASKINKHTIGNVSSDSIIVTSPNQKDTIEDLLKDKSIVFIDITSEKVERWGKFHPKYPHGIISIPRHQESGFSLMGIMESLKVFENQSTDYSYLTMRVPKQRNPSNKTGEFKGYARKLNNPQKWYTIEEARRHFLLPIYLNILEKNVKDEVEQLKGYLKEGKTIVILDKHLHYDLSDKKPLSFGWLLKCYLEDGYPVKPKTKRDRPVKIKKEKSSPQSNEKKKKQKKL